MYLNNFLQNLTNLFLQKVDRYLRNHTTYRNPKALPRSVPIPDLGTRGVSWLQVLAEDRKEEIGERSAVLRDTEGGMGGDSSVHLNHFRRSRNEIASSLPEAEVQRYKQLAQVISEARKTPPTAAAVFECVFLLSSHFRELTIHSGGNPSLAPFLHP